MNPTTISNPFETPPNPKSHRKNQKKPRFIFLSHGFAGRAYSYKKDLLDFDLNLISGQFSYNQLKERKLLCKQTTVIGYQKIDALKSHNVKIIFNNKKPVVLYNPHFTPPFSSWHFYGLEVLDFFHKNPNYNLIFAPHINLFAFKGKEKKGKKAWGSWKSKWKKKKEN